MSKSVIVEIVFGITGMNINKGKYDTGQMLHQICIYFLTFVYTRILLVIQPVRPSTKKIKRNQEIQFLAKKLSTVLCPYTEAGAMTSPKVE